MKTILNSIVIAVSLFTTLTSEAQTFQNITKPEANSQDYIVTSTETLIASKSIILKPNTWIKAGSTFVAKIIPEAYNPVVFSNENYVFTRLFQKEMTDVSGIVNNRDVVENITYFDGLGRPMQNISIKASPSFNDIITPIEYDNFGRQDKDYLPYMDLEGATASYRNGIDAIAGNLNYYKLHYPQDINLTNPNPFSQKSFESSPRSKVLAQSSPGVDWALNSGHEVKSDQLTNNGFEVRLFKVTQTWNPALKDFSPSLENIEGTVFYGAGELSKNVIKNENWVSGTENTTEEFTDKEGHLILKKIYGQSIVNNNAVTTAHETYYVYDSYGNLTYVLPPLSLDKLTGTPTSSTGYNDFSKYFDHNIFSRTSGGGSVQVTISNNKLKMVFSAGFNPVMLNTELQDLQTSPCLLPNMTLGTISNGNYSVSIVSGKLKLTNLTGATSNGFNSTFIIDLPTTCSSTPTPDPTILDNLCYQYKYDKRNRLIEKKIPGKGWEYIVYDKHDRPILTQDANLRVNNKWIFTKYDVFGRTVYTGEYTNNSETTRDLVQNLANNSNLIESRSLSKKTFSGSDLYYNNVAFPSTDIDLFTINYYDDYIDFTLDDTDIPAPNSVNSYGVTPMSRAKGLLTINKIRVLETNNWITNVVYYDTKGRAVFNYNKNTFLESVNTVKSELNFSGNIVETTSTHQKENGTPITVTDTYTFDHVGRILTQKQKINSQAAETIVENSYNNLGQLTIKGVGGKGASRLQTVNYGYNIRGWLKNINDINNIGTDLFAFKINHNDSTDPLKKQFNGNISQTFWKTANISDTSLRSYTYGYDALNRMISANDNLGHYNENPTYDKNGNIISLVRNGNTIPGTNNFGSIDKLVYTYEGNKLIKIDDNEPNLEGFKDGINLPIEYSYDANANMTRDYNKGITTPISYNYFNLPTNITLPGGSIKYYYDASGAKQRKIVNNIVTDYVNGFQYEDKTLKFFPHSEGYLAKNNGNYDYIYQYRDHLGNVRLSYGDANNDGSINSTEIIEENNYYPFGLKQKEYINVTSIGKGSATAQKYKYNGKELQDELGLGFYDYGARNYDPASGRWMNADPLAEKSKRFSPYVYALNNPVYFIDPDGMQAYPPTEEFLSNLGISVSQIQNGYEWTDNDGSWKYNSKNKTWEGQNGTDVNILAETEHLNEVVVQAASSSLLANAAEAAWNSPIARHYVSDSYSLGLTSNVAAFIGTGSTPINFTILTRGKEPGLYFTPTINASVGDGISANAGISFSSGMYSGNPREIESSFLQGHSVGASGGLGLVIDASVGGSFAPIDINDLSKGGFSSVGGQIGLGIEGSPASVINVQATYQYTPVVKPIFQLK